MPKRVGNDSISRRNEDIKQRLNRVEGSLASRGTTSANKNQIRNAADRKAEAERAAARRAAARSGRGFRGNSAYTGNSTDRGSFRYTREGG